MNYFGEQSDVMKSLDEIKDKITEESEKETPDPHLLTKLRYEQMLRGLFLQNF